MVSWDTCISGRSGYSRANHAEICSGDHLASSFLSTARRKRRHRANFARFGRSERRRAPRSATRARYFVRPPLAFTSRHTVDGERPRDPAIVRMESPAARPREISSPSRAQTKLAALPRGADASPRLQ